ncbi:zinc finger protein 883-like [Maniola hyperantus]|uniref:zinc finger protein 883-like n=1 Tax=Aphantopus hyperantus TaxID=2795564 RepID=UPI0021357A68
MLDRVRSLLSPYYAYIMPSRRETSARHDALYKMEEEDIFNESESNHAILVIPQHLTTLKINCAPTVNVYINVNITSADTEGNNGGNVYSGFCNVKVIDSSDDNSNNERLECGLILSTLSEEIMKADENRAREEMGYVDMPSNNVAVKQLMSSEAGSNVVNNPCEQVYQCEICKQIHYQISAFRHLMEVKREKPDEPTNNGVGFLCPKCKKSFNSCEKFEIHCLGHGNPDVECSICRTVFASKLTLQNHIKIHLRKHKCPYCTETYQKFKHFTAHLEEAHFVWRTGLKKHKEKHEFDGVLAQEPESETTVSGSAEEYSTAYEESKQDVDSETFDAKCFRYFLLNDPKGKECKKTKRCNKCQKSFDRGRDLKYHLIEHILRSSFRKHPKDDSWMLPLTCVICQSQTFSRMAEYKAHLREHAKLTMYKCTSCAKTFSYSSILSKRKRHGANQRFQCDICLRKFNCKKN